MKDCRKNQKVITTLKLEDRGQDFTELDILENGVILGNSSIFLNGRLSMIGIGTKSGLKYFLFKTLKEKKFKQSLKNLIIYIKSSKDKKESLPWETEILNYKITGIKKPEKQNRFIVK